MSGPPALDPDKVARVLAILRDLGRTAAREALLERILDEAIALCGAERGFVILEPESEQARDPQALRVRVARNLDQERLSEAYRKFSRGIAARTLEEGRTLHLGDAGADERFGERRSVRELKLRSVLCAPLPVEGRPQGVVYLDNRFAARAFTRADAELLELLATQAGFALESQRRRESERPAAAQGRAEQEADLADLGEGLATATAEPPAPDTYGLVGASPALERLRAELPRVAASAEPALILGESGTGKELVARALHAASPRRSRRFVALNCAAVPDPLLESELFGHRRGSWTGATADREGLFRAAHGGTLFLDEVGDTSPAMQAKLLRALQEGEVRPLGAERAVKVDVRLIAATHRDLKAAVAAGAFRQDLYYRLAVLTLRVPLLRDRGDDVLRIADHLLARLSQGAGPPRTFTDGARRALLAHAWPGNVRELENALKRAHALAAGRLTLTARDFAGLAGESPARRETAPPNGPAGTLDELERQAIVRALAACGGKVTPAAKTLGIDRSTLYRKLKKYGLRDA